MTDKLFKKWFRRRAPAQAEHLESGLWGEAQAEAYLKSAGMKILGRRVLVGKRDELDILGRDGETLVFIEVKTRRSELYGRPAAAVNKAKRHNMSRAALRYMEKLKKKPPYFRFDIVEVIGQPGDEQPEIRHLPNAFNMDRHYRINW